MAKTVAIAPKNVPPKVGPTTANSWPAVDRKLACVSARSRSDMMCSFLLDGQLWILKPGIRMTDKTQHNSNFASVACVRANKGWRHYANNPLRNSTYVNPNYGITLYRIEKRKRCRRRGWSHCIKCHLIRNLFIKSYLWLSRVYEIFHNFYAEGCVKYRKFRKLFTLCEKKLKCKSSWISSLLKIGRTEKSF